MSYKSTKQFISRPITVNQIPAEALERMVTVANEINRFNLTIDTVQNGDTVYQEDTKLMYRVIDHDNLDNSNGYQVYKGAVYWNNVREKPVEIVENENDFTIAGGTSSEKTLTVDETKNISSKVDKVTGSSLVADTEISKIHTQNTDTETISETFQIDSNNAGPKLKQDSGALNVRNEADEADAPIKSSKAITQEIESSDDLKITCGINKTLELQAAVWDDLRTPANNVKLDSVNPPTETLYRGGQVLSFVKNSNNKIYFNVQIPHNYKLGTDLEFHIHIVLPTDGAGLGVENVKFDFTYSWANINSDFPIETPEPATLDVQNKTANDHIFMEIVETIDGSTIDKVSSMLICSLERDVSVANNYDDAVYLLEVDFHYQIDTMGSRQEVIK